MSAPLIVRTRAELGAALADLRAGGGRVALVPTMGALHSGHAALLRTAREQVPDGAVVVSVFVNPLQFGPEEDLDRYPRTFTEDLAVCAAEGVDIVFAPEVAEVYPRGVPWEGTPAAETAVTVDPGILATRYEGASRPGHFRGVLTVVAKLFGLVRPDVAVFGQKDYQQLVLVRRMVEDLALAGPAGEPLRIVGAATVREDGGLALSSRNVYLTPGQRTDALVLNRALHAAQDAAGHGAAAALAAAEKQLADATGVELDYLILTDPDLNEYAEAESATGDARILVAARVGSTRLLDNLPLHLGAATDHS